MGDLSVNIIVKISVMAAVLFLTTNTVNAISCFQCNSVKDPGCDTITDNSTENAYYRECQPMLGQEKSNFFCRTITLSLKETGSHVRVVRSCGWERYKRDCYEYEDEDHKETVCQCFTDGCNSRASPGVLHSTLLAFLSILPVLFTLHTK
ncbi:hypothetical protein L9F63_018650 [Diploptera punctata]|uniref:Protein sleepless n=1 Tax=Diploptera punctata TaxID=6984 RepID=A0AAD7ZWD3_DIPPU|nr:hypothetical protein L9F63_018650 [Diploptera punctata]